jgi:hypothetical protein
VLSNKQEFNGHSDRLIQLSAPEQVAMEYEKIFTSLVGASDEITIRAASKNQADN